jgi:hypothetical protein
MTDPESTESKGNHDNGIPNPVSTTALPTQTTTSDTNFKWQLPTGIEEHIETGA